MKENTLKTILKILDDIAVDTEVSLQRAMSCLDELASDPGNFALLAEKGVVSAALKRKRYVMFSRLELDCLFSALLKLTCNHSGEQWYDQAVVKKFLNNVLMEPFAEINAIEHIHNAHNLLILLGETSEGLIHSYLNLLDDSDPRLVVKAINALVNHKIALSDFDSYLAPQYFTENLLMYLDNPDVDRQVSYVKEQLEKSLGKAYLADGVVMQREKVFILNRLRRCALDAIIKLISYLGYRESIMQPVALNVLMRLLTNPSCVGETEGIKGDIVPDTLTIFISVSGNSEHLSRLVELGLVTALMKLIANIFDVSATSEQRDNIVSKALSMVMKITNHVAYQSCVLEAGLVDVLFDVLRYKMEESCDRSDKNRTTVDVVTLLDLIADNQEVHGQFRHTSNMEVLFYFLGLNVFRVHCTVVNILLKLSMSSGNYLLSFMSSQEAVLGFFHKLVNGAFSDQLGDWTGDFESYKLNLLSLLKKSIFHPFFNLSLIDERTLFKFYNLLSGSSEEVVFNIWEVFEGIISDREGGRDVDMLFDLLSSDYGNLKHLPLSVLCIWLSEAEEGEVVLSDKRMNEFLSVLIDCYEGEEAEEMLAYISSTSLVKKSMSQFFYNRVLSDSSLLASYTEENLFRNDLFSVSSDLYINDEIIKYSSASFGLSAASRFYRLSSLISSKDSCTVRYSLIVLQAMLQSNEQPTVDLMINDSTCITNLQALFLGQDLLLSEMALNFLYQLSEYPLLVDQVVRVTGVRYFLYFLYSSHDDLIQYAKVMLRIFCRSEEYKERISMIFLDIARGRTRLFHPDASEETEDAATYLCDHFFEEGIDERVRLLSDCPLPQSIRLFSGDVSLFQKLSNQHLIEHAHDNDFTQHAFDLRFGVMGV